MTKKLLSLFLTVSLSLVFTGKVYAQQSTDINTYTIDVKAETGSAGSFLNIKVNGKFEGNALYYAKFVNDGDSKPTDIPNSFHDKIDSDRDDIKKWKTISQLGEISIRDDWYLLSGYDNVYILKCNSSSCSLTDKPLKLEKPGLPELSKRYALYYFSDKLSLSIFPYFPYSGIMGSHGIELKIGIIDDKDLLYKIYKKENNVMQELMNYAKNHTGKTFSCEDEKCNDIKLDGFNVENEKFYYLYINYTNDEKIYRDLSDISFAQARNGVISNDIKWNFEAKDDTQIENPKTSDVKIALVTFGIIVTGLFIIIGYKKIKKKG